MNTHPRRAFKVVRGLCLEIGRFPAWLARPVVVTICRDLFKYAQKYYNTYMCDDVMHDEDEDDEDT